MQSRSEKTQWAAIRDHLAEVTRSRDSAELRLDQVRELIAQAEDMTYEEFLADLKDILE